MASEQGTDQQAADRRKEPRDPRSPAPSLPQGGPPPVNEGMDRAAAAAEPYEAQQRLCSSGILARNVSRSRCSGASVAWKNTSER